MATAYCEVCGKNLGRQSKRPQWQKRLCESCANAANEIALDRDMGFLEALEEVKLNWLCHHPEGLGRVR